MVRGGRPLCDTKRVRTLGGPRLPALERGAPASQSEEAILCGDLLRSGLERWSYFTTGAEPNRHSGHVAAALFLSRVRQRVGSEAPSIGRFFGQHNVERADSAFEGR